MLLNLVILNNIKVGLYSFNKFSNPHLFVFTIFILLYFGRVST